MTTHAVPLSDTRPLTLEQKIGQLVMIDFTGLAVPDDVAHSFSTRHWGGVILFAKNIERREQVAALCSALQAAHDQPEPLFIGIDQEGGIVDRLPFDPLASSPGAMALAAAGDVAWARETARVNGLELASLGINVNFAPCVDVNCNPSNPIIGVRSYGETADQVTRFGLEVARGYRDAGIAPCAKHFPGHGDTSVDSHLALPALNEGRERLDAIELAPYRALIGDGLEMIMSAHIVYPALDGAGLPATLSRPILTDVLRSELGFDGVIITDSMSMKAVADNFGVGQAAVMAVQAGADVVLACGTREAQEETWQALFAAVRGGVIDEARIDASVARIRRLKAAWAARGEVAPPPASTAEGIDEVARASTTVVRNDGALPLRPATRVALVAPALLPVSQLGEIGAVFPLSDELRARDMQVTEHRFSLQEGGVDDGPSICAQAREADVVVLCLYARGRLSPEQAELTRALLETGRPVVAISLNSPYVLVDVSDVKTYVCTYGYARSSVRALADVLCARVAPRGRLPVSLPGLHARGTGLTF